MWGDHAEIKECRGGMREIWNENGRIFDRIDRDYYSLVHKGGL